MTRREAPEERYVTQKPRNPLILKKYDARHSLWTAELRRAVLFGVFKARVSVECTRTYTYTYGMHPGDAEVSRGW